MEQSLVSLFLGGLLLVAPGCGNPLPHDSVAGKGHPGSPASLMAPAGSNAAPVFRPDVSNSESDAEGRKFQANPVQWLKGCLAKQAAVTEYTCLFTRKEKPRGHDHIHSSLMEVEYRDIPFAVRMKMLKGGRLAKEVLFADGENKNQMVILPTGVLSLGGLAYRNPLDPEVMHGHRNPITSFGLRQTLERSIKDWETLAKESPLQVRWLGLQATPELDGKHCYVVIREGAPDPDDPTIRSETIWIDPKTGQLVGNRLLDEKGGLVAEYWYNNLVNNPGISEDRFKIATLK